MDRIKVIIIGAAGRDFHNFNILFKDNESYEVVAFTANQIPYISGRKYPSALAGRLYPKGISIFDESELGDLIKRYKADLCVLSYSDLPYAEVMHKASIVNSCDADFIMIAPNRTMIKSTKPVIAVCAVRTGCGKSQVSRYISKHLKSKRLKVAIIRHPMPYGVLKNEIVERFASLKDLEKYKATIEEREDYEPHIRNGFVVFAGVDYEKILRAAEKEADVIIWDGGNNDAPFIKPDLLITVADPLRIGHESAYYPGEIVSRMADVLLINKINAVNKFDISALYKNLRKINKKAGFVYAQSIVNADKKDVIKGKSAMIIEDGPSITHGGLRFAAGTVAAKKYHAGEIVDAHKYACGSIAKTYDRYPELGVELPAMGYSIGQIKDLEKTINAAKCDIIISATPTKLSNILHANKPIVNITYELKPLGSKFDTILNNFVKAIK